MAKFRTVEKWGTIKTGLQVYKKNKDNTYDSPFTVYALYVKEGSGVQSVSELDYGKYISSGSRMVRGNQIISIQGFTFTDWYVNVDAPFGEKIDAEAAVE